MSKSVTLKKFNMKYMAGVGSVIFHSLALLILIPIIQCCTSKNTKASLEKKKDSVQIVLYYLTSELTSFPGNLDDPDLLGDWIQDDLGVGYIDNKDFEYIVKSLEKLEFKPLDFNRYNSSQFIQIRVYKRSKLEYIYSLTKDNLFFGNKETVYAENDSLAFLLRKYGQVYYNYDDKDALTSVFRELKKFNIDSNKLKSNYDLYQSNYNKLDRENSPFRKIILERKQ